MAKIATFAQRLQQLIDEAGISRAELSRRTGISKSNITRYLKGDYEAKQDGIYAITQEFGISEAWLMGYDAPKLKAMQPLNTAPDTASASALTAKDERDIAKELEKTLGKLSDANGALMFDGEPLDDETKELLRASLENQIRMAKMLAKQKFTPKKYRKNNNDGD